MAAKKGDKVKVHYTLKSESGETLESSMNAAPAEFIIGDGKFVRGFEKGLVGMKSGETKTITVSEDEAYGIYEEKKIFEFSRERLPQGSEFQTGQVVRLYRPDGSAFPVTVIGVTEKGYKMDANHPLAGKTLVFEVKLLEIGL